MGAVQLKKEITIPTSPFCTVTSGCSFEPTMRLKETDTGVVLDLCQWHGNAVLDVMPHAYIQIDLPEGITNHDHGHHRQP
jgi:hypothetical protein